MAKRPRQRGMKNKPATMQEIIAAVGRIIREEGYQGLKVNNIAKFSGRNRNLISRYFSNLAGLQRAYVLETDYWVPFFERFRLTAADDIDQIKETFTDLMQENLRYFQGNPEMQKIILWQISQYDPLMAEISTDRELKGELLFSVTDPSFQNTDVNFRAVTGLLLGGIYYMVLHARTNNSTVCGIDLNQERDQQELLRTIAQVIGWACAAANDNETKSQPIPMMNYQFELLDRIAAELSERKSPAESANPLLVSECNKLKRGIASHVLTLKNETQIRSYLKMVMNKLGEVIEDIYNAEHSSNLDADLLVTLLKSVLRHHLDVLPNEVILPKLYCVAEAADFNKKWHKIKAHLESVGIDPTLIGLVYFAFDRLSLTQVEVTLYDLKYLRQFCAMLESEIADSVDDEESLIGLLIGLGYNFSRFHAYYTKRLKVKLSGKELGEKQLILEAEYAWVGQILSRTPLLFDLNRVGLAEDLHLWINAELRKGLGLSASTEDAIYDNALNTVMSTSELSAWQKLQYDAGVYVESNVDVFTGKVSYNFKTKRGARASGKSIKSKLYGKEVETYKMLRPFVNKMKEDIDRFLM